MINMTDKLTTPGLFTEPYPITLCRVKSHGIISYHVISYRTISSSVCLSIRRRNHVHSVYLQQYYMNPFHINTSCQSTSESVGCM